MKFYLNFCLLLVQFCFSYSASTSSKAYTSFKPRPWCTPSERIRYPKTNNEVVAIVREAISKGVTVKAFGARHSQTDIICTEGIPIDMQGIRFFQMNDDGVTATFGAGVHLREATRFLRQRGRGLRLTPAYGIDEVHLLWHVGVGYSWKAEAMHVKPKIFVELWEVLEEADSRTGDTQNPLSSTCYNSTLQKLSEKLSPNIGNITLGGAIGTGSHGSTIKHNATLSSQVVGVTIIDGMGNVRKISEPGDLRFFRVHVGLLGIVVDITLYTVPLFKTLAHNYVARDEVLTNGDVINWARNTDQIALYWYPAFHEVVVANWTIVDVETPGDATTNDHVGSTYAKANFALAIAKEIILGLTSSTCAVANSVGYIMLHIVEYFVHLALLIETPYFAPIYTEDEYSVKNPAVGYYDKMSAPICYNGTIGPYRKACFWEHGEITILDNEFAVDLNNLPYFINDVKDIVRKTPTVFPVAGILLRFSDQSDVFMSPSYGRQTVFVEFYLLHRNDRYNDPSGSLAGYQTILQILARKYRGRSHWGKSGLVYHDRESLDLKLDPHARRQFVAAMNKFDPSEVFINNFGRRLKETGTKVDVDPKEAVHCALLDNCICSKNSDCGNGQMCTTLPGYSYRVCKTRNEVPEFTVERAEFPPAQGILGYFLTIVPTLAKAAVAKCKPGDLVVDLVGIINNVLPTLFNR